MIAVLRILTRQVKILHIHVPSDTILLSYYANYRQYQVFVTNVHITVLILYLDNWILDPILCALYV